MTKKILIANWKMQLDPKASVGLAKQLSKLAVLKGEIVICPDFVSLSEVGKAIKGKLILGAQNLSANIKGAYTGQVAAASLKELGAKYVIIGHSETRQYLGETDELLRQKLIMALQFGLKPVLCVGEKKGEKAEAVLERQLSILKGLKITAKSGLVIAYEPVWAIGSGRALSVKSANELQAIIKFIVKGYTTIVPPVIYGGSVDEKNVKDFMAEPYIDGLLVGGASLRAQSFNKIANIIFVK